MIITRFAPSPTGDLHIGNIRTALFSWLFAKKYQGKFVLRIEDTDLVRSTKEATQIIFDTLKWLGLGYDIGPIYQTERLPIYREFAEQLIREGKAYYCHCSLERLEKLREEQINQKLKPKYDNCCRNLELKPSLNSVIRFKNPLNGIVEFQDLVYGDIVFQNSELDDLVLIRHDGMPTYNFCVVIDDAFSNISHVIRGDDHINNTPKQINIIKALNQNLPIYAHLPTILNAEGKRMSKRDSAASIMFYRDEGILAPALLNYLVRLGWSHGDQEIFSLQDMIGLFDLKNVHRSPATFDLEKLIWINSSYMQKLTFNDYKNDFINQINKLGGIVNDKCKVELVANMLSSRYKTLKDFAQNVIFLFKEVTKYDTGSYSTHININIINILHEIIKEFLDLDDWNADNIHSKLKDKIKQHNLKFSQLAQPIRIALTGNTISPSIDVIIYLLGKQETIIRLKKIVEYFNNEK